MQHARVRASATFDANDELYPGHRWHAVMHAIVAAARANGLRCVDGPYSDLQRRSRASSARAGSRGQWGSTASSAFIPTQLATANRVFGPTDAEVAHARRVVEAYEPAWRAGRGALSLDGKMIDAANVRMARVVLENSHRTSTVQAEHDRRTRTRKGRTRFRGFQVGTDHPSSARPHGHGDRQHVDDADSPSTPTRFTSTRTTPRRRNSAGRW